MREAEGSSAANMMRQTGRGQEGGEKDRKKNKKNKICAKRFSCLIEYKKFKICS